MGVEPLISDLTDGRVNHYTTDINLVSFGIHGEGIGHFYVQDANV